MNRYFINDRVEFWNNGERFSGTIYSARKKLFGRIEYVIAVKQFGGFDPDGIGKEKYRYHTVHEDDILQRLAKGNA